MAFDMAAAMQARRLREVDLAAGDRRADPDMAEVAVEDVSPELGHVLALVADIDRLMLSAGLNRFGVPRTFAVPSHATRLFRYRHAEHVYVLECGGDSAGRVLVRVVRMSAAGVEEHRPITFIDRPGHVLVAGLLVSKYIMGAAVPASAVPSINSELLADTLNTHILSKFGLTAQPNLVASSKDAKDAGSGRASMSTWGDAAVGAAVVAGAAFVLVGLAVVSRAARRR